MSNFTYTTQKQVRAAFWQEHQGLPGISKKKITDYSGNGKMYNTDTRTAFVDFVDFLHRNSEISDELAEHVTPGD